MGLLQMYNSFPKRDYGDVYLSSRGVQGLTCSVVFTALSSVFVGLRLYTRVKLMRRMESNDWMVVIALVSRDLLLY